jgi:hypothetical protein
LWVFYFKLISGRDIMHSTCRHTNRGTHFSISRHGADTGTDHRPPNSSAANRNEKRHGGYQYS